MAQRSGSYRTFLRRREYHLCHIGLRPRQNGVNQELLRYGEEIEKRGRSGTEGASHKQHHDTDSGRTHFVVDGDGAIFDP